MRLPLQIALALLCVLACAQLLSVSGAPVSGGAAPIKQSYYDLLGVSRDAAGDAATLKRAYRKLALVHHPDKATSDADRATKQEVFVRLANAFEVLSNRRLRVRYDHLLSQGKFEYDGSRDWDDFDVANGFKRRPQTKAQKEAAFRFKTAQEMFKKAADDAEEFALWTAIGIAAGIALLPAAWMFYSRHAAAAEAVAQRKERSSDLKATQQALAELQAEQKRAAAQQREEDRAHQRELKQLREEAAAEARAAKAASGGDEERAVSGEWELVKGTEGAEGDEATAASHDDDDDSDDEPAVKSGSVIKCVLCKKSFKSQQQSEYSQHTGAMRCDSTISQSLCEPTALHSPRFVRMFGIRLRSVSNAGWRTTRTATSTRSKCRRQSGAPRRRRAETIEVALAGLPARGKGRLSV